MNGSLRNTSIKRIFLRNILIQNHFKVPITNIWQKRLKIQPEIPKDFNLRKKSTCQTPPKTLDTPIAALLLLSLFISLWSKLTIFFFKKTSLFKITGYIYTD